MKDSRVVLDRSNHAVFSLNYHLILVVKYRRKVITDSMCSYLKNIFIYISERYGMDLVEMNHDRDHVHILFEGHPDSEISKFINTYKSATSRMVKKDYPEVRECLWKSAFWSSSYCLITAGGAPLEILKQYVENQGGRL